MNKVKPETCQACGGTIMLRAFEGYFGEAFLRRWCRVDLVQVGCPVDRGSYCIPVRDGKR